MSDPTPENGGNQPRDPKKFRRSRNLPLIFLLVGLMVIVLMNIDADGEKTAALTYAQFRELGRDGGLEQIELHYGQDQVEIRGTLNTARIETLIEDGKLDEATRKSLTKRKKYRVEAVMRGMIDSPEVQHEMESWGVPASKLNMKPSTHLLPTFLFTIAPWLLIGLFFWFFIFRPMRQAGGAGGVLSFGRSRAKLYTPEMANVTFADVAGVEEAKEELREIVEFLRSPQKFQRLGGRIPRGVMLYGPPGCGKTLLAKAVAGEAGVPFFAISGSDFVEMFVGVGASRVRDLFQQAKEKSPCLIFLDEIDAVGRRRGSGLGGGHDEREQTLNQILVEMDGFETDKGIIVIAATNRPDVLDPALLRPGRFDRSVTIDLPDVEGREAILRVHARKVKMAPSVELSLIARGTPGFSGAELEAVINEAAIGAAMAYREWIMQGDLEEARDKVRWGRSRRSRSRVMTETEKSATAWHEAGHALSMLLLPNAEALHKVTIIPRGQSLGSTMQLPERDRFTFGRQWMLDQIIMLYSGRIAEQMYTGDLSSGASNDIKRATELARAMVTQYGMSELGPLAFGENEDTVFLGREVTRHQMQSAQTIQRIDDAIEKISRDCYRKAEKILTENRDKLELIADALCEFETLSAEEVELVLEGGDIEKHRASSKPPPAPPPAAPTTEEQPKPDALPGLDRDPKPGFA
ncbi:MAG: ATP-dependent zinc metalloprotease FtsH [Planctomycetota bacterium]|jgi:cell division protease FtsH